MSLAEQARRQSRKAASQKNSELPDHLGVKAEFDRAVDAAKLYFSAVTQTDRNMITVMMHLSALHEQTVKSVEASVYLKTLYARRGIRITKATPNPFTPLLKLIIPDLPKETARRSAATLDYARIRNIAPNALGAFIKNEGGFVKCSQAARRAARPKISQAKAEKEEMMLSILKKKAKTFVAPTLSTGLNDGFWNCLIENRKGRLSLVSVAVGRVTKANLPLGEEGVFLDFE